MRFIYWMIRRNTIRRGLGGEQQRSDRQMITAEMMESAMADQGLRNLAFARIRMALDEMHEFARLNGSNLSALDIYDYICLQMQVGLILHQRDVTRMETENAKLIGELKDCKAEISKLSIPERM